ncbi:hypothetical protein [Flavobacterium sp.]|uniref:hypothetical protein n=1 Tax=Flavobacterium sp. TaxID=239 RepID=UPI00286D2AF4|nr:hypothetical protein [Flavobacterium sp.]
MLNNFKKILLAFSFSLMLTSCSAIEGIFKAGMGVGIFVVVAIVLVVIFIITRFTKKD